MALDRITEAVADRTDPTRRHLTPELRRRLRLASIATVAISVAAVAAARMLGASADYSRWTARDWILARIQSVLDYIANPDTVLFSITSWTGDTIIKYGLQPLHNFLSPDALVHRARRLHRDCTRGERLAAGAHDILDARTDRSHGAVGACDGHRLAGARGNGARGRDRTRARHPRRREPAILQRAWSGERRFADAATARLPHSPHLPDARVDGAGRHRRRPLRVPDRRSSRRERAPQRGAERGRGRNLVRCHAAPGDAEGADPAGPGLHHARRRIRGSSWCSQSS